MPLLQIQTSAPGSASAPAGLLKSLSVELARELGKPESYMMVSFTPVGELLFAGSSEPACFASLKSIGSFSPAQTERLSALLCQRLGDALGVAPSRIYIEFVDAQPQLWGHNGSTFA
jgi:phenylpyruvate tautomerase PptA (4-oxalocrotonate tautomerase family)